MIKEHLNIVAPHNSYVICEGKRATLNREKWDPGDIPVGTDFIYLEKNYQRGVGIPNLVQDSDTTAEEDEYFRQLLHNQNA